MPKAVRKIVVVDAQMAGVSGDMFLGALLDLGARADRVIEAMKTVAELIAPISGEVVEINETLEDDPRQINMDPYVNGWMIKIKIHEPDEVNNILTPQDYIIFVAGDEL